MKEGIGNKILRFNAIFFVSTNLSKTEKGNNQNINFKFYKVYTRKGNANACMWCILLVFGSFATRLNKGFIQ